MQSFILPPGVESWMESGWKTDALVLYGKGGCGKTEFLRALCVFKGWPYFFINSIDQMRGIRIRKGEAIIFDEVNFTLESPEWFKNFADVRRGHSIKVRYENVFIPAGAPRLLSTNAGSPDEFIPKSRLEFDYEAMLRRCFFVRVTSLLFIDPNQNGRPQPASPQFDEPSFNALREMVKMKQEGFLSDTEFAAAKCRILGIN